MSPAIEIVVLFAPFDPHVSCLPDTATEGIAGRPGHSSGWVSPSRPFWD